MSKQTINIGASPNDGTGTPLRTSFDYCNQNFTEIYTALGGGVALPGATTQVIFNDGGTNLAGDAGLVYNKTTDALTIAGPVNAASATITGDLTVDTSTLKVDSTNNRVGILTATPNDILEVVGSGATGVRVSRAGLPTQYATLSAGATGPTLDASAALGALSFGLAGSTAMTLNSTGLGIGVSPSYKIHAQTTGDGIFSLLSRTGGTNNPQLRISLTDSTTTTTLDANSVGGSPILALAVNGTTRMTLDSSGNVGVGVTPSAWATYKALQVSNASLWGASNNAYVGANYYFDGSNRRYIATGFASEYSQESGFHSWFYAPSGTAGGVVTLTQAMAITATGELLVGTATTNVTSGGVVTYGGSNAQFAMGHATGTTSGTAYAGFQYAGTQIGSITQNGTTGVLYNITSDYRLKESVVPLNGGLARVNALKPSIYNWKSDGSTGEGFLAHELAEVVPFAVSGEKDDVNEDGKIKPQGIDMSRVVPILVAAIQELTARVQTLEAR